MYSLSIMFGAHTDPKEGLKKATMSTKDVLNVHAIVRLQPSKNLDTENHLIGTKSSQS